MTLTDPQLCGYFSSSLSEPYSAAVDMFKLMPVANPVSYEQALQRSCSRKLRSSARESRPLGVRSRDERLGEERGC